MLPQFGVGGGTPTPRNPRVASIIPGSLTLSKPPSLLGHSQRFEDFT
jgi:hypothetical protein